MDSGPVDWKAAQFDTSHLDVFLLGCVDFDAFLLLQDRLAVEIQLRRDHYGIALICEHPPVMTLGRDGSAADLNLCDDDGFPTHQLPTRWVGRGGGTWRHGPGQLSISVLIPVERLGRSALAFRDSLIQSVLQVSEELDVAAQSSPETPGVRGRVGQFAFVGGAIHAGVSQFGLILNVAPRYDVTSHSPQGVRSSSLAMERHRPLAMPTVRESLTRHLAAAFGYEEFQIRTGHPWLRRTTRTVPIHA